VTELEEQEVDFRRYGGRIAQRWWLPVLGLVAGLALGLVLSLAGGSVWKATALITLGQPFSPTGSAPVNSFATNPRAVAEIVRSESALKAASRASGMRLGNLRGHVSSAQVGVGTGAGARTAVPLISLTVQGPKPAKVERAAATLAKLVVEKTTAPYVGTKIQSLKAQQESLGRRIAAQTATVQALTTQVENRSLAPLDRLALVTQLNGGVQLLGQLQDQQSTVGQQLALGQFVESARVIQEPSAAKTSARSRRTSMLVAGLIGLILGTLAALAWDAFATRSR
jgi:uncharacterized protein involved in exopolysaccharide biosynthesis